MKKENRKYILVRMDGIYSIVEISDRDFLSQAYKLIECRLIETVPIMGNEIFIVDEEGRLKDKSRLNFFASCLYQQLHGGDFIVGNVLIGCYEKSDVYGLTSDVINKYVKVLEECEYENKCT